MTEEWRPVIGWDGRYEVSNLGRLRSHAKGDVRVLSTAKVKGGKYFRALLASRPSKRYESKAVHVLVAEAFLGPRPEGYECAHLNGDGLDNRVENLMWKTHKDNEADKEIHGTRLRGELHGSAKLSANDVQYIRSTLALQTSRGMGAVLARKFGVTKGCIYAIRDGRIWKEVA